MPEISVVVPAYQVENSLEICVSSILAQTFSDFEIILVDDHSTDRTGTICSQLEKSNPRIRFLRHSKNRGAAAARNTGLLAACGKYVAFVDSDDFILESALEDLHDAAERWNADIVDAKKLYTAGADSRSVFEGQNCSFEQHIKQKFVEKEELLPIDMQARMQIHFQYKLHVGVCNKLYRRDFLAEHRLLFPEAKTIAEDFLFTGCCVFLAKRYLQVPFSFYVYCNNPSSLTKAPKTERHLALVLSSMMDGASYLAHYLKNESFFAEDPIRLEALQQHWFGYCKRFHIYPRGYYRNGKFTRAADAAVKAVLKERLGAQTDFVAYLFHTMNAHYAEALELMDANEKLKTKA